MITQYADLLPMTVITEIMGLPIADLYFLKRACEALQNVLWQPAPLDQQLAWAHDFMAMQQYLAARLAERRRAPQEDVLTSSLHARMEGERFLSTPEIVQTACNLLLAGNISKIIGNALVVLLSNPVHLHALREDMSLMPNFVEEILRMNTLLLAFIRTTTEEVELGGVTLPPGAHIQVVLASVNYDETLFPEPDSFDIHRSNLAHRHYSFGKGVHYCLGAPLVRLELPITLEILIQRLPNLRFQPNQTLHYEPSLMLRGLKHLILEWDAAA